MRVRRRSKRILYVGLGLFVAVFLFSFLMQKFKGDGVVDAASLAGFDPGYIISDWQMGNYNSMNEAEIQAFLTAKNPCGNRDYGLYQSMASNYSSIKWHWDNGHFICISEERFGDGEVIGSGDTAAHIIWQAAQDYRINPQVLIVLLQKEQGLITDDFPNSRQYRSATGYGCPDTAPCSTQYYGFKNQVRKAAAMFRTVLDGGWTNYPLGNNYIQYNPNAGCGGSVVNIRSLATSALYRYTPYQPNAGALAAGYGTAYCGAYGNRNFYLYFEDWFGGVTTEAKWIDMDTPRYMMSNKAGLYYGLTINKYSDVSFSDGEINYFSDKTFTPDGRMCLRTVNDKNSSSSRCIIYDDLSEMNWKYEWMDTPRYLEARNGAEVIELNTRKVLWRANQYNYYDKKVFLPDGDMCLVARGGKANACVLYSNLREIKYEVYAMETPRYLMAGEGGSNVLDAVRDTSITVFEEGDKRFYDKKIILPDNSICLIVGAEDKYNCVRFADLDEVWVDMEKPRELRMLKDSYKINAITLEKDESVFLPIGMRRKYLAKRYLRNGEWCLQTEYDYERKTDDCVLFRELTEV